MKRIILISLLGANAFFLSGCGGGVVENINANININANAANANTGNTNASNAQVSEEVPVFSDADTALKEGDKFFDASENEKATNAYKQATKLNPDLAEAHFKLGVAYALVEALEKEQETPTPETEASPTPKPKKNSKKKNEPERTNSIKAFENAVTAYKKIVKKDSKDAGAFFNLGRSYSKLNDDKEARKALETAVKLEPENSQYQTELGVVLIELAKYDDAVRALKKAVSLDETNLQAQELLETAEAGKKRVDFGVNKIIESKKNGLEQ